ncbi:MAG: PD-(D/E)XK nuclease family protein [Opitutales bacterium]
MPSSHYHAASAQEALECGILPWLQAKTAEWSGERIAVLAPAAYTGHWIKFEAAKRGIALVGIDFLTPGRIRAELGRSPSHAFNEAPRLDLAEFALIHAKAFQSKYPNYQDISSIHEAYSILDASESAHMDVEGDVFFEYIQAFDQAVKSTGFETAPSSDRRLFGLATQEQGETLWEDILVYGFGPTDLSVYAVLRSLEFFSNSMTFIQWEPFDARFSELWMNSWEARLGIAEPLPAAEPSATSLQVATELLLDASGFFGGDITEPISVFQTPDSRALLVHLLESLEGILERAPNARIALLYQSLSPELSWVLQSLERAGVPVCIRSGKTPASWELSEALGLWLVFQKTGSLDDFVNFARMLHQEDGLNSKLLESILRALDKAFSELQLADFKVLHEWVRTVSGDPHVSGFLDHWGLLEEEDSAELFLEDVSSRFDDAALEGFFVSASARIVALGSDYQEVHRALFFEWLSALYEGMASRLEPDHERIYSPFQAVTLKEAVRESWTHVCVLDGSHQHWNSDRRANPWISEEVAKQLNRRCMEPSESGTGEWVLRGGRIPYTAPADERWSVQCLLYMLFRQELEEVNIYFSPNDPLDSRAKRSLAEWVDVWVKKMKLDIRTLESCRRIDFKDTEAEVDLDSVREATEARYDVSQPFGKFDFSAPGCQDIPRQLAVKNIEYTLRDPAAHWYLSVLSLSPRQGYRERLVRALSEGSRLHRWLQWEPENGEQNAGMPDPEFSGIPHRAEWEGQIAKRADADLGAAEWVFQQCEMSVPDWWKHQWRIQRTQVRDVLDTFYLLSEDTASAHAAFEIPLPPGVRMGIESKKPVILSGRMDVLLSTGDAALVPGRNQDAKRAFRVLDFKSGNRTVPTAKQMARGESLQLLLYARALWEMGSRNIAIGIISRNTSKAKWLEIDFSQANYEPLIQIILRMVHTRTYGYRPGLANVFGFQEPRPISFTDLPETVIEARWQLTHPEWEEIV